MSHHTSTDHQLALIGAFHAVYDLKDELPEGSAARYTAYEAIQKIEALMLMQGFLVPHRFDGEGRTPSLDGPTWRPKASSIEEFVAAIEAEGGTSEGFGAAIEAEGITA